MNPKSPENKKVFVAGHRGMVGSAIVQQLQSRQDVELITRTRDQLDLLDQAAVRQFFESESIDEVYLAAAKVGGIHANNTFPAEFIYQNLTIETNVIHEAYAAGIRRLLLLGSSCIYPRLAEQPMPESALLTSTLEPSNEPYALAKIAGIKLCESYNRQYGTDYRSVMPSNLYGPGDNFHPQNSHVIPALIRRFHECREANAEVVTVWGTGNAMREFLHVDDMAAAGIYVMQLDKAVYDRHTEPMLSHINVGTGKDCTIRTLAETIRDVVGFEGDIEFDSSKPDGAPRKLLNVDKLKALGWSYSINLPEGLVNAYQWYLDNCEARS